MTERKKGRDAGDGRFVSDEYVREHPDTTITQTIDYPDRPKREKIPRMVLWGPLTGYVK